VPTDERCFVLVVGIAAKGNHRSILLVG
jgi:hypothetical protein